MFHIHFIFLWRCLASASKEAFRQGTRGGNGTESPASSFCSLWFPLIKSVVVESSRVIILNYLCTFESRSILLHRFTHLHQPVIRTPRHQVYPPSCPCNYPQHRRLDEHRHCFPTGKYTALSHFAATLLPVIHGIRQLYLQVVTQQRAPSLVWKTNKWTEGPRSAFWRAEEDNPKDAPKN